MMKLCSVRKSYRQIPATFSSVANRYGYAWLTVMVDDQDVINLLRLPIGSPAHGSLSRGGDVTVDIFGNNNNDNNSNNNNKARRSNITRAWRAVQELSLIHI